MSATEKSAPAALSNPSLSSRTENGDAQPAATTYGKPWFTEGYWSNDPSTAQARKIYTKILAIFTFAIIILVLAVLSIYWGALWSSTAHVHNLKGWIVDFDGSDLGRSVVQAAAVTKGQKSVMTWEVHSASQFPNGVQDIEWQVLQDKVWAIVSVNAQATSKLNAAAAAVDSSYNASTAITVYSAEARSENAYRVLIRPNILSLLDRATLAFNTQFVQRIAQTGAANVTALAQVAPQLLSEPTSYTIVNLRPFDVPVAAAVTFVGLIYLLILAFVVSSANYAARVNVTQIEDRLTFRSLMLMRIFIPITAYFLVSLFYCLLSVAFQVPFARTFGHPGFLVYWMISWFAMCALGFGVEAMITILTPRFLPFFLLLWIISNVSVCYFPIELLPRVYHYGYAMPFYNVQQAVRTIVFNTKNQLGLNFGVQLAWVLVSLITMTLFQYHMRRQTILAREKSLADAQKP
ncbi:hypothetical protein FA95DRAFT_1537385 [Auriscalpium vulgare]|uniref:Uncharacterized protein n=1 Tax=Auriscalpium vulgare TaxID=40419 RepID=A0ACB8S1Z9_9AGAM|nr:hypothetical protein FA95DRAFT_1537385 [Auriscalpium vulgare]